MPAGWRRARLLRRQAETGSARTLELGASGWPGHLAGQHVDVRLTADDGYQAVRSYSLAAPADGDRICLGVQPVPGGEVSPYLADVLPLGADIEVRGPLGGWFVWRAEQPDPVLLVAGGSGIVPLMAMVRSHREARSEAPFHLVYSVRDPEGVWYREELAAGGAPLLTVCIVHTRRAPPGDPRPPGHLGPADLRGPGAAAGTEVLSFVCGPTAFVEHVSGLLVDDGHPVERIRTERFG